jgi:hypothetical protein
MPMPRSIIAICLAGIIPAVAPALAQESKQPEKVSFYFAAHEDDWQLFMNPSAFEDVVSGAAKTVFVHLTAGDAGLGVGFGGRKHPFYLARENGAEAAIRFMANANSAPAERVVAPMTFNGHSIYRVSYRNTVGYFLRVRMGIGPATATTILDLNRSSGWLTATTRLCTQWMGRRFITAGTIWSLHCARSSLTNVGTRRLFRSMSPRPMRGINPQDHSDHLMTAKAALDAVKDSNCVRRVYYVDYASSQLPQNLDVQKRDMESSVLAVTLAGVQALDHSTSWHHYDESFVGRNYFRVQAPAGRCDSRHATFAASPQ